jgi:Trypsin-co-occurring domain 1
MLNIYCSTVYGGSPFFVAPPSVPVRIGDTEFLVEVAEGGGPQVVGLTEALSFDGVRETLEAVAGQLALAWQKVQPAEATVKLGLSLSTKTGKLTALLVEGGGQASLKVTLTWKPPDR